MHHKFYLFLPTALPKAAVGQQLQIQVEVEVEVEEDRWRSRVEEINCAQLSYKLVNTCK